MQLLSNYRISFLFIFCLVIFSLIFWKKQKTYLESFENKIEEKKDYRMKVFVINLASQTKKLEIFDKNYNKSNLKEFIDYERFDAVEGKKLNPTDFLTDEALQELDDIIMNGKRKRHYELTPGGIGCFLSHLKLYNQLLQDDSTDIYLILEDDSVFTENLYESISYLLQNAPSDWDMLYLGMHRRKGNLLKEDNNVFMKPEGFWGTYAYIVNKKGAKKVVDMVNKTRIDGQIDAYLSRMQQRDEINIYGTKQNMIHSVDFVGSTIQTRIDSNNKETYNFRGYYV